MGDISLHIAVKEENNHLFKRCVRKLLESTFILRDKDEKFYQIIVTCSTILAFFISLFGVNTIINFAVPVLAILYPIYMCLFVVTLFDKFIKYVLCDTWGTC